MSVTITTFGYTLRDDVPEAAVVADVRNIPGSVVAGHEESTGLDADVQDSVMSDTRAQDHRDELLAAIADADHDTTVAIGCYQGRHRSVALAEVIAAALRDEGHTVTVDHLDLEADAEPAARTSHRPGGHMAYSATTRYWGSRTPTKVKSEFFNAITTPAPAGETGDVATIRMYGPIDSWGGWWGISTADIATVIDDLPDSVTSIILRINSPGGEVSEAIAILNMLRAHSASTLAVVDGLAASAASVIAAGCDETVMSPGTQMMIHSPWTYASGNAADLRKAATTLDSFESTLIEIYEGKAGANDWPALLAEETWLNSQGAVDLGLADRVAVVPDAGDAITAGDTDPFDDDFYDAASLRVAAHQTPAASASGSPTGKETVMAFTPDQLNKMRADLGLAPDADETAIASAVANRNTAPALPEGVVTIDATTLEEFRSQGKAGAEALERLRVIDRDRVIDQAITAGKFAASRREHFTALMDVDPEGTKAVIDSLEEGTIPVAEIGYDAGTETVAQTAEQDAAVAYYSGQMGLTNGVTR